MRKRRRKTRPKFTRKMQKKLAILFMCIVLALFALNFKMTNISLKSGEVYAKQVLSQQRYESKTIPYQRGSITDRNGTTLAMSTKVYKLILDPKLMLGDGNEEENYMSTTLTALTNCFGYEVSELRAKIEANPDSHYVVWDTNLTYEEIEEFQNLMQGNTKERPEWFPADTYKISDIKGVWFEDDYIRSYPYGTLACDVLGFSNSENVGSYGIEQEYNSILNGMDGRTYGYLNEDSDLEKVIKPAQNGSTVVTTLDMNLQMIGEKHIEKFMTETGAENVAVLMMNPNTGEILAMATAPVFDLNDPSNISAFYTDAELESMTSEQKMAFRYELWKNYCISETYEPGSTTKLFTIAAGLEEAKVRDGDMFECKGVMWVGGWDIWCHNTSGDGWITVKESVMYSCNVALMQMAQKIGKDLFCDYLDRFHIGRRTGIDLPGEEPGLVYSASSMDASTLATNSFGQNYNTTVVQVAAAFSSLINGGYYYEPHMVKKIVNASGGTIEVKDPTLVNKTVSRDTSKLIREYLYETVEAGTGSKSKIEGYAIGGKTGTAEKQPRDKTNYVVSFISCAPIDDPEVLLYVVIDRPHVEKQDNAAYATILSHDIWQEVLPYMGIYPGSEMDIVETTTVPEPQTDENGETVTAEPQTDENGETILESTTPVRPTDEVWEEPSLMEEATGETQSESSSEEESTAPETTSETVE